MYFRLNGTSLYHSWSQICATTSHLRVIIMCHYLTEAYQSKIYFVREYWLDRHANFEYVRVEFCFNTRSLLFSFEVNHCDFTVETASKRMSYTKYISIICGDTYYHKLEVDSLIILWRKSILLSLKYNFLTTTKLGSPANFASFVLKLGMMKQSIKEHDYIGEFFVYTWKSFPSFGVRCKRARKLDGSHIGSASLMWCGIYFGTGKMTTFRRYWMDYS